MKAKIFIKFLNYFGNFKLKDKLMISYAFLIIIPLGIMTVITSIQVSGFAKEHISYSAKQVFEQTNSFLSYKLGKIMDIADFIIFDRTINNIVNKNPIGYTYASQLEDLGRLRELISSYQNSTDIHKVKLYVNDQFLFSQENENIFSMKDIVNKAWYIKLTTHREKEMFCKYTDMEEENANNERTISIIKKFLNPNNYSQITAVLRIDIREKDIKKIIKNANSTKSGVTYIVNFEGNVVTSSNEDVFMQYPKTDIFMEIATKKEIWNDLTIGGVRYRTGFKNVSYTDWYLVSMIRYDELIQASTSILNQIIFLMFMLAILAYIIAYFLSNTITKKIRKLMKRIKKLQDGDFDTYIEPNGNDEIGELINNFNFMLGKIKVLIDEKYEAGIEAKSFELKALQAQINPHFLYNTLDMVNWMAIKNDVPEISKVVKSLAKFYKLSLNKGKDIVFIRDEIQHVLIYSNIQNMRFDNRIEMIVDVDENIYKYKILKIILQPIVENAIIHGIMESEGKKGEIVIWGRLVDGVIVFRVIDNGVGMDEDTLERVFREDTGDTLHGYGIKNINNRIKLYYGFEYGLSFSSTKNKGTTAEVRISAKE